MKRNPSPMRPVTLSARQRWRRALLVGGIGCAAGMLSLLTPESIPSFSCTFHELTGHSCFTCGLTRSILASAHGQFTVSLGYHLMGPVLSLGLLLILMMLGAEALTGRRWTPGTTAGFWRNTLVILLLVWATYGGIRLALELT